MKELHLNIVSPERELFNGHIESVTLPGTLGTFTILTHHAPIVSSLLPGRITFRTGGEERQIAIQGGFVEMSDNCVSVCVEEKED